MKGERERRERESEGEISGGWVIGEGVDREEAWRGDWIGGGRVQEKKI